MLHDAWYSGRSSSAGLAAAVAKARVCLHALEVSRVWEDLEGCPPEWITVPEGPEAFVHDGWPIYAGPDLVYRPRSPSPDRRPGCPYCPLYALCLEELEEADFARGRDA